MQTKFKLLTRAGRLAFDSQ